jgi:hypothetical protein
MLLKVSPWSYENRSTNTDCSVRATVLTNGRVFTLIFYYYNNTLAKKEHLKNENSIQISIKEVWFETIMGASL